MSSNDDMEARHGRMLAELAEAGMGVARSLYAATQQASVSNRDFALLAEAFHTVSRSIRQTIALELKLRHAPREPAASNSEPPPAPAPAQPPPERPERPEQVYWNEYERADWSEPLDSLLVTGDTDAINAAIAQSVARIQRGLTRADKILTNVAAAPGPQPRSGPKPPSPAAPAALAQLRLRAPHRPSSPNPRTEPTPAAHRHASTPHS
jgi:hypothetical protein